VAAEEYLTKYDVARMFQVEPRTVTRWVTEGRLQAIRVNRSVIRFARSEVERFARAAAEASAAVAAAPEEGR
jgi:excisionase family DNA binding protein